MVNRSKYLLRPDPPPKLLVPAYLAKQPKPAALVVDPEDFGLLPCDELVIKLPEKNQ